MWNDNIPVVTRGFLNRVNDVQPGYQSTPFGPSPSIDYQGTLGNGWWQDDSNIVFDTTMGTVYGGHFRYVRLSSAAAAVVVGQIVFWDTVANAADNLFQVTTAESGTADAAMNWAGIVLNSGWSAGYYSIIQDVGPTYVKFRAALTAAGAIGSRAFCAAVGGADLGKADVIDSGSSTAFSDVSKMFGRYLGISIDAPTNGGLDRVYINVHNVRG
jgi:hypothetical protein